MGQRSRVVVGSIVGAVAVHLAMLACSGDAGVAPSDGGQARADAGAVDAGDILDAVASGDLGGALDAVADVVRDAMGKAADAETRDAHAGGDGGVAADAGAPPCACEPRTPAFTFAATVDRGRGPEQPRAEYSTLTATANPAFTPPGGMRAAVINGVAWFYLPDGSRFTLACNGTVRADRSIQVPFRCRANAEIESSIPGQGPVAFSNDNRGVGPEVTATVERLTDTDFVVRFASIVVPRAGVEDGGTLTIAGLVFRGEGMRGNLTPPNAYRP